MNLPAILRETPEGLLLNLFVQPRASKNAVVGIHADALKIRLTSPPVEGAANKQCLQFLAKTLGLPKSALDLAAGHASRHKQVLIRCQEKAEIEKITKKIKELTIS